jgi:hypothetical protein
MEGGVKGGRGMEGKVGYRMGLDGSFGVGLGFANLGLLNPARGRVNERDSMQSSSGY